MTNEQTTKMFETALNYIQENYAKYSETEKTFRNDMCSQEGMPTYEETVEMYDLAVQALQKQIPQSPVGEDGNQCSICWAVVEGEYDLYCPMCGQKLEVSE